MRSPSTTSLRIMFRISKWGEKAWDLRFHTPTRARSKAKRSPRRNAQTMYVKTTYIRPLRASLRGTEPRSPSETLCRLRWRHSNQCEAYTWISKAAEQSVLKSTALRRETTSAWSGVRELSLLERRAASMCQNGG
jgi:hypothetical protein